MQDTEHLTYASDAKRWGLDEGGWDMKGISIVEFIGFKGLTEWKAKYIKMG